MLRRYFFVNILRFLCGAQRVFSVNFFFLLRKISNYKSGAIASGHARAPARAQRQHAGSPVPAALARAPWAGLQRGPDSVASDPCPSVTAHGRAVQPRAPTTRVTSRPRCKRRPRSGSPQSLINTSRYLGCLTQDADLAHVL